MFSIVVSSRKWKVCVPITNKDKHNRSGKKQAGSKIHCILRYSTLIHLFKSWQRISNIGLTLKNPFRVQCNSNWWFKNLKNDSEHTKKKKKKKSNTKFLGQPVKSNPSTIYIDLNTSIKILFNKQKVRHYIPTESNDTILTLHLLVGKAANSLISTTNTNNIQMILKHSDIFTFCSCPVLKNGQNP